VKQFCQLLLFIFFIFLVACGPSIPEPTAAPEEPTSAPETLPLQEQSEEGLRIALTPTADSASGVEAAPAPSVEEAYPIPIPTPILMEGDYPDPPPPPPESPPSGYDAYPETSNTVWILFPVGEQCSDESRYVDLVTAVADLTAAGITVYESEVTELIVCSACGCPTSAHFRVSIDANQLATAEELRWEVER
jgi:hypothetical protein